MTVLNESDAAAEHNNEAEAVTTQDEQVDLGTLIKDESETEQAKYVAVNTDGEDTVVTSEQKPEENAASTKPAEQVATKHTDSTLQDLLDNNNNLY